LYLSILVPARVVSKLSFKSRASVSAKASRHSKTQRSSPPRNEPCTTGEGLAAFVLTAADRAIAERCMEKLAPFKIGLEEAVG